jgi:hypothetical protein
MWKKIEGIVEVERSVDDVANIGLAFLLAGEQGFSKFNRQKELAANADAVSHVGHSPV